MENNQLKKKNTGLIALIALLLIITIIASCVGMYAWARYSSSQQSNATAEIAKWSFDIKLKNGAKDGDAEETVGPIDLADTIDFAHVAEGTIAPGTSGQFQVIVNTTGTEIDTQYDVTITVTNCPRNITFTRTDDKNNVTTLSVGGASNELTRTLEFSRYLHVNSENENENGKHYETITWNWPYEAAANETAENKTAWDSRDNADNGLHVTMEITVKGTEMLEEPSTPVEEPSTEGTTKSIGDPVPYQTTLTKNNGESVTLSNWEVFYVDGNYTYLILDDYLPNAYISNSVRLAHELVTSGTYCVWAAENFDLDGDENAKFLMDAMTTKDNWSSLLTGTINGHTVNEAQTDDIWAMGSPTLELWVNSWNQHYSNDTLSIGSASDPDGSYIKDSEHPKNYFINLSNKEGYKDSLYFPHHEGVDECYNYWLATYSPENYGYFGSVSCNGVVFCDNFCDDGVAFRPVIRLPSSVVNQ